MRWRLLQRTLSSKSDSSNNNNSQSRPRKRASPVLTAEQLKKREEYAALECHWESIVDLGRLNKTERKIHALHKEAVQDLHWTYVDPASGLKVVTRFRHFLKGKCCGNACRHCVYNHEAVAPERRAQREFNSAFWIDKQ